MTREAFHAQLDALAEHSGSMCMVTGALLEQATRPACQTDQAAAHWVIAGAVELDRQRGHAEELVVRLLALQAPVRKLSSWMRPAGVIFRPRDLRSGVR